MRHETPATKYLESIHEAQCELLKQHISKDEFIILLSKVDVVARMDSDISEVEYELIRTVYDVAKCE